MTERAALVSSERGLRVDPDLPLAVAALADAGHLVDLVRWDDGDVEWSGRDLAVVRSCCDYAWRLEEFLGWAASVPRLRNGAELLRWNTDKTYLRHIERAGLPVVPTVWEPVRPEDLPPAAEWVVWPSVSAGSRDTARWTTRAAALTHAAELTAAGRTAMAQPYLASVDDLGETAMLFIGGRFSHAVRKGPLLRRGEGVRQDLDSRGDLSRVHPTTAQRDVAQEVFEAIAALVPGAETPLYARIDLVHDEAGRMVASYVAPVLVFQVLVMAPVGLGVLAGSRTGEAAPTWRRLVVQPLRTPVVIGCALGILLASSGLDLPPLLMEPVELIAALAVPAALLAYGMTLHGAPRPAADELAGQVWLAVALKNLAVPAIAYALGRWVADLDGLALLAVTVISALPTAQNVFVYAAAYDRGTLPARDVICSAPCCRCPSSSASRCR